MNKSAHWFLLKNDGMAGLGQGQGEGMCPPPKLLKMQHLKSEDMPWCVCVFGGGFFNAIGPVRTWPCVNSELPCQL